MRTFLSSLEATTSTAEDVVRLMNADVYNGLTSQEAELRLQLIGKNEFLEEEEEPLWRKYLGQFKDPMIVLLLVSATVSIFMRQFDDAISITVVRKVVCADETVLEVFLSYEG